MDDPIQAGFPKCQSQILTSHNLAVPILHTVFSHIVSAETQYIRPKVTVNKCAETIQGRKVSKAGTI